MSQLPAWASTAQHAAKWPFPEKHLPPKHTNKYLHQNHKQLFNQIQQRKKAIFTLIFVGKKSWIDSAYSSHSSVSKVHNRHLPSQHRGTAATATWTPRTAMPPHAPETQTQGYTCAPHRGLAKDKLDQLLASCLPGSSLAILAGGVPGSSGIH